MKRKARLDYSTSYLPFAQLSQGHKRMHTEGNEDNAQECDTRQIIQEQEKEVETMEQLEIKKKQQEENENKPLRDKPAIIEKDNSEETVEDIIKRKFETNPMALIKQGKENQYGNFRSYYDHRYDKKWSDPRLKVLERDWFLNKEVLDIGCNDGSFTLQIAIKYFPFKIVGIDIDFNLINKAVGNYILLEKQQARCKNTSLSNEEDSQQNQQSHYKKLRDKLSRLPKSFIIDKSKQNEKLEETYLIENALTILQDDEQKTQMIAEPLQVQETLNINEIQQSDKNLETNKQDLIEETQQLQQQNVDQINVETENQQIKSRENIDENNKISNQDNIKQIANQIEQQVDCHQQVDQQVGQSIDTQAIEIPQKLQIRRKFPQNAQFRMENYVESTELTEKYDTICCFSTTKWIHLNFGDQGIKRLFDKVHRSLRINGLFILEPQEWRSYKKKQSFSDEFKKVLKSIKLHPGEFKQYLLENYKFILEKEIVPELNSNKVPSFFKRVVYVFRKVE